jgi:anti-sigma factor (TIGR02949 family)
MEEGAAMSAQERYHCEQAFKRLDDFVDRELSADEQRLVAEHLATCQMCASEFTFEAAILDGVRDRLRRIAAPPGLLDRVLGKLRSEGKDKE